LKKTFPGQVHNQTCPKCKKEILSEDIKFMLPLEIPYMNIYFHRDCYLEIEDNIEEFIQECFKDGRLGEKSTS
jgi:hypothetical protein